MLVTLALVIVIDDLALIGLADLVRLPLQLDQCGKALWIQEATGLDQRLEVDVSESLELIAFQLQLRLNSLRRQVTMVVLANTMQQHT